MVASSTEKKSFECKGCGAKLIFAPGLQSLKCDFCGTVFQLTADFDQILTTEQASFIVPMKVEEKNLELAVFEYVATGKYTPDDMIENSRFVKFERFYAPVYRFSGRYDGTWSASFGYDRQEAYTDWVSNGQGGRSPVTKYQTVTDWSPANGSLRGNFVVVGYAGSKLPENIATLIEKSESIRDLTSDTTSYVSGIEVEAFQKSERDTFDERGQKIIDKIIESDVLSKSQGEHQRDWNWNANCEKEGTSVLMPVCHVVFEYNENTYSLWSDGADSTRFVADELPHDIERENEVQLGFLPLGAAALGVFASWISINQIQIREPGTVYAALAAVLVAALIYGIVRRRALLSYSKNLRESILNFQKASRTHVESLSEAEQAALLSSFSKPERPWIAKRERIVLWLPTLVVILSLVGVTAAVINFEGPAKSQSARSGEPGNSQQNITTSQLCEYALDRQKTSWDQSPQYAPYATEAIRRGMTIANCRQALGIKTPQPAPERSPSAPPRTVPETGTSTVSVQLQLKSREFLDRWYRAVSGPNGDALIASNAGYADRVNYFGKSLSRDEVLAEFRNFMERWPSRYYQPKQETLEIYCEESSLICAAKGLIDFDSRSPSRNERSWGVATFEYRLQFSPLNAYPKIFYEAGEPKQRNREPLSSTPPSQFPTPPRQVNPTVGAPKTSCDELAANPTDRRKSNEVQGASFNILKSQADRAISACETASAEFPNELRFQYQLARALEHKDRARAFAIHEKLVQLQYPAAFDNLGWMYFRDRNNSETAVGYFRQGIQLEDADSMISLADMIDRGMFTVANPSAMKIALFQKAAELGHPNASRALAAEMGKTQQSLNEEAARGQMVDMFNLILRNIPRR